MAIVNRLLGVVLGLALLAGGLLLVIETVLAGIGRPAVLVDRGRIAETLGAEQTTWSSTLVTSVLVGLVVVGLVLLLLQLVPRLPDTLPVEGDDGRGAAVDRRALAGQLRAAATEDNEVLRARSSVRRNRASVRAKAVPGAEASSVRARLEETVGRTLASLQLDGRVRPAVSVTQSRERGE